MTFFYISKRFQTFSNVNNHKFYVCLHFKTFWARFGCVNMMKLWQEAQE